MNPSAHPVKLLVADDEPAIVTLLKDYFELQGYAVLTARNGEEALQKAAQSPGLILLDVNMPGPDGFEVCARIREYVSCPILFLTARIEDGDKIAGFRSGGDDYILKPFSIGELGARVEAHLRREERARRAKAAQTSIRFSGDLVVDYGARRVCAGSRDVGLAPKEFDIVELLSMNAGQVFDKERIYERVWGYDGEGDSAVIAEHVRRIRAKLAACTAKSYLETVWGVGYKWVG